MADTVDQLKNTMASNNPGYIREYEHAKTCIWDLNHSGIKLDILDKMKVLGYIKDKLHEKDSIAKNKWQNGERDPDPYDEAAVYCAAICQYLDECCRLMEECRSVDAALEYEQYKYSQAASNPSRLTNNPKEEAHLAEIKAIFKTTKKKFTDSLHPRKSQELAELIDQLK